MTRHRPHRGSRLLLRSFCLLGLPTVLACEPSLSVPEANRVPIAEARVLGREGQNVVLDYMGAPLTVTLDGTASRDPDGSVATYRWLSGTAALSGGGSAGSGAAGSGAPGAPADDAGIEMPAPTGRPRWVPAGVAPEWPDDVAQPTVTLGEGVFEFVLWVIDDKNAVSEPSVLEITVRTPLDPAAQACVDDVYEMVAPACKACLCTSSNPMCRTMAAESVCNQTCWALLNCIATRCPDFRPGGATTCLTANCASSLGGATGATAIGPCVTECASACRSGS